MKKTKIFAAYLPQYHETEDNNKFWGKGFTDWVGVKKAEPQFEGHQQPRIPLNNNYYDLSNKASITWQADLAKKYGIDGFNIYHYWFKNGKQELERPAELLLSNPQIDIQYFFSWDNCSWKRTWSNLPGNDWGSADEKNSNQTSGMLAELDYGGEAEWNSHFEYLLPFFKDKRYLKINGAPVFAFMTAIQPDRLQVMGEYWKILAKKAGFSGLYLISQKSYSKEKVHFDNVFIYEPIRSSWGMRKMVESKAKEFLNIELKSKSKVKYLYEYDYVWKRILRRTKKSRGRTIPGCFVQYDDTPRRGKNAGVIIEATPAKFKKYFNSFYAMCCKNNVDFLLITAWNEWGEGAYLEPDTVYKEKYLEVIKDVKVKIYEN